MTTNVLVTLSGYGGGDVSASNEFVSEAFKGIFSQEYWVNPSYGVKDDVFHRADVALTGMKSKYESLGGDAAFCIFGNSKGGVVARTLLSRNKEHNVMPADTIKCVITHDSPHNGAVLPLGYQYFLRWAGENGYLSTADKKELDDSLLSQSAQQLLLYYLIPEKTLEGRLVESKDPVATLNAAYDRLYRRRAPHDSDSLALQPLGIGKKLRKPMNWSITAKPHAERVKLMDYLAKHETKKHWCGPSFNIGVATGSLGRANTAKGPRILQLTYDKRWDRCNYFGYLQISAVPGEKGVILATDSNVDNWVKLPKGQITLKKQAPAWASGPGSHYNALGKDMPEKVLKGIQEKVKKMHSCSPEHADEAIVHSDIAFIPTVSALDVRDANPFALKGLSYDQIIAKSTLDAVFYPPGDTNLSHGDWQDVIGPDGAKGAAGAYRLVERVFTGS